MVCRGVVAEKFLHHPDVLRGAVGLGAETVPQGVCPPVDPEVAQVAAQDVADPVRPRRTRLPVRAARPSGPARRANVDDRRVQEALSGTARCRHPRVAEALGVS